MANKSICNTHCNLFNQMFKKMSKKDTELNFYKLLHNINIPEIRYILEKKIKDNWVDINSYLNEVKRVINYLKDNNNFKNSNIGNLIIKLNSFTKKVKSYRTFIKYIPEILDEPELYHTIKDFLYILSNKKRCKFIVDTNLKKEKLNKSYIKKVITLIGNNLNLIKEFIYLKYRGPDDKWGSKEYESAYKMFKTLNIINRYYDNPLELLGINYKIGKLFEKDEILDNLQINYILQTHKNNLENEKINSISQFIILMKKKGFNLWYTVDFIVDNVFEYVNIDNVSKSIVYGNSNIEYQKGNNSLAIKIYLLCKYNLISNVNIFQNFSI